MSIQIQQLVENKNTLNYQEICTALIQVFGVDAKVNWESVLPAQQQQEYFGGETLRLVADHPILSKQKDIRPIALKKGNTSQMLFMYVSLKDIALPKKNIQEVSKKFISGGDANRYIIWFFGNTENTQLKVVLSAKEGKKVVLKTLPFGVNQPYYKTYNFILQEVNTQVNQFFVEPTELWKALWKAFDISIINKKFYEEIKAVFDELIQKQLPKGTALFKTEEAKVQFSIRLIGRIIFCWFLKRKGIIKEEVLSSEIVKKNAGSYYHELLEILFFDVFNTPEKERKAGLPKVIAKYPFLNGGLFEAQENDFKDNLALTIGNDWFYNLFSKTLEKYNFTVDENSSSNAEIAIDPEMLGRIFENLLAEQNPETGESARKSTGSFYTPREIVDYMVEQSIIEYLKTSLGAEEIIEKPLEENLFGVVPFQQLALPKVIDKDLPKGWENMIEDFVHTQLFPLGLQKYEKAVNDALSKVKVLDPACGSGAFPMGILQKIVALKQPLNPKVAAYKLKLDTIQNSIYGIDIQPMAVELSRLRCWLSLVVDEEADNIKSLPNLDFKFVCADSLVDVPENEYVRLKSQKSLEAFGRATTQYFNPDYKKKKELQVEIKKCLADITHWHNEAITSIIKSLQKERNSATPARVKTLEASLLNYTQEQETWDSYKNIFENKKVIFFNLDYFFPAAKEGFDVVIGNPPYVQLQDNGGTLAKMYESQKFKTFARMGDIYSLFYEKGMNILKKNGILCFITSNKWMRTGYGEATRKFFAENSNPILLIDFAGQKIFEAATVDTNILLLQKTINKGRTKACLVKEKCLERLNEYVNQNSTTSTLNHSNGWVILNSIEQGIKEKIESIGTPLKDWDINIYRGILTGYNEAFIIDGKKKDELIEADPKSVEIIRPILRGRDIKRYGYEFADLWLINTHNGVKEKGIKPINTMDYPAIKAHLDKYYPALLKRSDKGDTPYNLRNCAYIDDFYKQKIIWLCISDRAVFAIDNKQKLLNNAVYFFTGKNLESMCCLLNSKVIEWYFDKISSATGQGTNKWEKFVVEQIPIPKITNLEQNLFIGLIKKIIDIKSQNISTKSLENQIDELVYDLYKLTDEEKKIIRQ